MKTVRSLALLHWSWLFHLKLISKPPFPLVQNKFCGVSETITASLLFKQKALITTCFSVHVWLCPRMTAGAAIIKQIIHIFNLKVMYILRSTLFDAHHFSGRILANCVRCVHPHYTVNPTCMLLLSEHKVYSWAEVTLKPYLAFYMKWCESWA